MADLIEGETGFAYPNWEKERRLKLSTKILERCARAVFFLLSLPFRYECGKIGKSFLIRSGYSVWKCNLRYVTIGNNVSIGRRAWILTVPTSKCPNPKLTIGDNVSIGDDVTISAAKKVSIGKNCLISYNVSILDHNHAFENVNVPPLLQGIDEPEEIEIGDDCFFGAHSFILKGVVLGKHCVVGANSVVTTSFEDFSVIAGVPAKKIRTLT
jgi:acetyltransferase-like isoleucine patch superfamily enzyme